VETHYFEGRLSSLIYYINNRTSSLSVKNNIKRVNCKDKIILYREGVPPFNDSAGLRRESSTPPSTYSRDLKIKFQRERTN